MRFIIVDSLLLLNLIHQTRSSTPGTSGIAKVLLSRPMIGKASVIRKGLPIRSTRSDKPSLKAM